MKREQLIKFNKLSLIKMVERLEKENRLLRSNVICTCMNCGKEFDYKQANICEDAEHNVLCPFCDSSDVYIN